MTSYWLIKAILLVLLIALALLIIRPIRSARSLALRRLAVLAMILFACFAVLFPGLLNRVAVFIGVEKGINLLVYTLVLALFAQMATSYRRDADAERRLTLLARAIALDSVHQPEAEPAVPDDTTPDEV